jgi:hypothetical protein
MRKSLTLREAEQMLKFFAPSTEHMRKKIYAKIDHM